MTLSFVNEYRPLSLDKRASRQHSPSPNRSGAESPTRGQSRASNISQGPNRTSNMSMNRVSTERLSRSGLQSRASNTSRGQSRSSNMSMNRPSTERLSQSLRQEELKAIMETRKSKRTTLTRVKNDRNSILEETVLEDLCETTGLEAKNNRMR